LPLPSAAASKTMRVSPATAPGTYRLRMGMAAAAAVSQRQIAREHRGPAGRAQPPDDIDRRGECGHRGPPTSRRLCCGLAVARPMQVRPMLNRRRCPSRRAIRPGWPGSSTGSPAW
jgi:hypothetical protein